MIYQKLESLWTLKFDLRKKKQIFSQVLKLDKLINYKNDQILHICVSKACKPWFSVTGVASFCSITSQMGVGSYVGMQGLLMISSVHRTCVYTSLLVYPCGLEQTCLWTAICFWRVTFYLQLCHAHHSYAMFSWWWTHEHWHEPLVSLSFLDITPGSLMTYWTITCLPLVLNVLYLYMICQLVEFKPEMVLLSFPAWWVSIILLLISAKNLKFQASLCGHIIWVQKWKRLKMKQTFDILLWKGNLNTDLFRYWEVRDYFM